MPRRGLVGLVVSVVLAAGPAALAAPVPEDATWEETYITSADGTRLHADVLRPKGFTDADKTPAIVIVGPYFGNEGCVAGLPSSGGPAVCWYYQDLYDRAFERGYSIVQVSSRGFGASGGCSDFFGPGDQADAEAAVRWAATQPWSTGKVGTYGLSYDGGTQTAVLARRVPGHAAAVVASPATDAYRVLYMNGNRLHNANLSLAASPHAAYQALSIYPAPLSSSPEQQQEAAAGATATPNCVAEVEQAEDPNPDSAFWRARNMIPGASGTKVPTLWAHGFVDANVQPDQVHDVYASQRGPKRLWFAQTWHAPTSTWEEVAGRGDQFIEEAFRWFDRYLKGEPAAVEDDPPAVIQEGRDGKWRREAEWPAADAYYFDFPVRAGSYLDAAGNKAEPGFGPGRCMRYDPRCAPIPTGMGTWTFTPPLPDDAHIAGVPHLTVNVRQSAPAVNVVALLYDVDENNRAALITRGVYVSRRSGEVAFDLWPQDWHLKAGHRIGLLLSGSDEFMFRPGTSGTRVEVTGGRLSLPLLSTARNEFLDGLPSVWIEQRETFEVDPEGSAVDWAPPPRMMETKRLRPMRLKVKPTRTSAERKTHFCFRAYTDGGRRLRGVTIRLLGQQRRTDRRGHTGIDAHPVAPGRYLVEATRRGYRPVRKLVHVVDGG